MKKQWFRLPALVVTLGMLSSAVIVSQKSNSKSEEIAPIPTAQMVSIEVEGEIIQEMPTQTIEPETEMKEIVSGQYPEFSYSKDWDYEDSYLLAKIAMAEAEGENIQTKTLVILAVLNRVYSDEFPDTIYDVIFQYDPESDVYQFSPVMPDGRWWTTEPNEDCWEAVKVVMEAQYDYSGGALYFESCDRDSWHSKNLDFLYQSGEMRFYK